MKHCLLTSCLLLCAFISHAQKFEIKGTVRDSLTQEKLQSATVFLEAVADSTLIAYSISDAQGLFTLKGNTGYESVRFYTSFQGYKDYYKLVNLKDKRYLDLGIIDISEDVEMLDGILVTAKKAPITVKQDTLEFNAQSFNTRDDATLEDVLKELPGVEVDKDGKITVNGKEVKRVLVNGKEFFGDDPQIALKNLPKEILDKIQVTESKTDEQKATGEEGDANASEINITIDEDKNKGWFSRLTAGAGTDERYSLSGIANYFNGDFKVSVLGSGNNINSPGFSFDEVYDALGNSAYSISQSSNGSFGIDGLNFGGNNNGITESASAGVNLSNDWGEAVKAQANYFYGNNDTRTASETRTTRFLPDRTFTSSSSSTGNNTGESHRISSNIRVEIDTLSSISIRPSLNINTRDNRSSSTSTSRDENGDLINEVAIDNASNSTNTTFNNNLYYYKRFKEKGTFISAGLDTDLSSNERENFLNSTREVFGTNPSLEIQDQLIVTDNSSSRISPSISFRKKLSEAWSAGTSYRLTLRKQENERSVFDQETGSNVFNNLLSNDFTVNSTQHRPSAGIRYNKDKLRVNLNAGVILQDLRSEDALSSNAFNKDFTNAYLSAYLSYSYGKHGRIYLNYRNNISVPSITQLQPVEDRSNPQNIRVGNPDLDAIERHNVYFNFSNYDWENGSGFYAGGSANFTNNQVSQVTITGDDLIRNTTYTNVDGVYGGNLYTSYSKSWKKDEREVGFDIGINGSFNSNKQFTNGVLFESQNVGLSPNLELNYSYDDLVDLELSYDIRSNRTTYDLDILQGQDFVNQTAAIDLTTFWPEKVTLGIRGEYNKFGNVSDEFDDDSIVLIASLGYKFAQDKAVVKIKAYDLLNEVIGTRRTVSEDFIQDRSNLVLQQYFILSFTYKLSKFGGKDPNENSSF